MKDPRTAREALIAEMLGELDELLRRAEHLPGTIADAEAHLARTIDALNEAGDKYRMAVTAFTEQARTELTGYLQLKAAEVVARTVEEQRAALQEAARAALRHAVRSGIVRHATDEHQASEFSRPGWTWLFAHGLVAVLTSLFTATFVLLITKIG